MPLPPLALVSDPPPPPVTPLPPQGPAPPGVSQVDPSLLVEPVKISSDTFGPAEGGDPTRAVTVTPRHSARLAVPSGFPPRPSSPPLQPVAVDSGAAGGGATGGADSGGAGSGASRLQVGGTGTPGAGGAGTAGVGGSATGGTGVASAGGTGARLQETLSPERLREWAVHWGSPGGGASRARTARAGGAGNTGATGGTGGAAAVGAAAGSPGGGAAGSGGAGPGGASAGVPGVGRAGGTSTGGTGATRGTGGAGPVGASVVVPRVGGTGRADTRGATGGTGSWAAVATGAGGSGGATTQPQQSVLHHLLSLLLAATEFPVAGSTPPLPFPPTVQSQPQLLPGSPLPALAPHTAMTESFTKRREPASHPVTPVCSRRAVRSRPPPVPCTHIMALSPSSVPQCVVLPSPPASSLPHVPETESDLIRTASPSVTRLLATVLTGPAFESATSSALVANLIDFAPLCRLDYDASLIAMDVEMASWKSTGTYVDEVPPHGANIVDGMWIFRLKRPPSSPPAFKARYVARGFRQREGVDIYQTFSTSPKMTILRVLLHVAARRDYELHSLDFSTAFLQGSLHEAMWLRRPRGFTESFPEGTQWSLRRPVYELRQAPREWHDTLRSTLAALGFAPSTADPSLFLRTDPSLLPFYVFVYVDDLVFATTDTEALALVKAELQERHTCTDLGEPRGYLGLQITQDRARRTITLTQSHMVQ
ncbi:unnamed protein product [Closterium sp. NIES-54]